MIPAYGRESANFSWGKCFDTKGCGNIWKGQTQQTGDNNQEKACKKLVFCRSLDTSRPFCFERKLKGLCVSGTW